MVVCWVCVVDLLRVAGWCVGCWCWLCGVCCVMVVGVVVSVSVSVVGVGAVVWCRVVGV